jgi:disulfide bond formation protein DsbB
MAATRPLALAQALALGVPLALLAGAYYGQYFGGLFPCEMCWWQRYAHFAALPLALLGLVVPPKRAWVALAGLAILTSGLIGAYHAGVEYRWWEGLTECSAPDLGGGDALEALMRAPLIRCDEVQWSLFGISLAGFNFLISTAAALAIFVLLGRKAAR